MNMHYSIRFVPYAILFCLSLISVNLLFSFIKKNYPEAVNWSSDVPSQALSFAALAKLGPFLELTSDSVDSLVEIPLLIKPAAEKNLSVFVAFRSPTCPVARNYARSLQSSLVKTHPEIDFVAVFCSPEGIEEFKQFAWDDGRLLVDPSFSFWNFIW